MVYQQFINYPHLNVFENIAFPLVENYGYTLGQAMKKVNHVLELVDLSDFGSHMPSRLSGGQKKRLVIALALLREPKVLLLDEIYAALDVLTIRMMQETIVDLQQESHITTLITDHQARDLLAICDKAIILSNSKIVASGTPNDLIKDESANKFYFGNNFQFN